MEPLVTVLTVRNLSDEVLRALRVRAALHGCSMEAEVRSILESAIASEGRVKLGSLLAGFGRDVGLAEDEFASFETARGKTPTPPMGFE